MLSVAGCLVVVLVLWPGLGLYSVSGWSVVIHTYLYYFPLSLSSSLLVGYWYFIVLFLFKMVQRHPGDVPNITTNEPRSLSPVVGQLTIYTLMAQFITVFCYKTRSLYVNRWSSVFQFYGG